jgi:hypothetical protein
MQVFEAVKIWLDYHKTNSREKTLRTYKTLISEFCQEFGERNLDELSSEEILSFWANDRGTKAGDKAHPILTVPRVSWDDILPEKGRTSPFSLHIYFRLRRRGQPGWGGLGLTSHRTRCVTILYPEISTIILAGGQ